MNDYNFNHPHKSLGNKSPKEFLSRFDEEFKFLIESEQNGDYLLNLGVSYTNNGKATFSPSLNELWEINSHRELISNIEIDNGGTQFDYGFYWSSSEVNITDD
jgi:hypothetical protein